MPYRSLINSEISPNDDASSPNVTVPFSAISRAPRKNAPNAARVNADPTLIRRTPADARFATVTPLPLPPASTFTARGDTAHKPCEWHRDPATRARKAHPPPPPHKLPNAVSCLSCPRVRAGNSPPVPPPRTETAAHAPQPQPPQLAQPRGHGRRSGDSDRPSHPPLTHPPVQPPPLCVSSPPRSPARRQNISPDPRTPANRSPPQSLAHDPASLRGSPNPRRRTVPMKTPHPRSSWPAP